MTSASVYSYKKSAAIMATMSTSTERSSRPRSSRRWSASAIFPSAPMGVTGVVENIRATPVAMLMSAPRTGRGGPGSAVALRARLLLVRRLGDPRGVGRLLRLDGALLVGLGRVVVVHQALGLGLE